MGVALCSCGATPLFIVSVGIGETRSPLVPRSKSAVIIHKMGDRCRRTAIELLFLQFKTNLLSHRKLFNRHDNNNQSSAEGRLRPLCSYQ